MADMDMPLVSIIIPNRNGEQYLREAVESALRQTYPAREVVVVDDGSTDGSRAILDSFGDAIYRAETGGSGAPAARNAGLRLARGEFVKFLDSDDVLLPDCLTRQVERAQHLPLAQKAIIYGDAMWVNEECVPLPGYPHRPRLAGEDAVVHILLESPLTSCPLHRREYLEEITGFDPLITKGQEQDLHLRLVLHSVEFVHYPGVVYQYRQHKAPARISNRSLTRDAPMQHSTMLLRQLALLRERQGPALSPEVDTIFAQRFWAYGRSILREGEGDLAAQYFAMARKLDAKHCIIGNGPYPVLARTLGPFCAERIMAALRNHLWCDK